MERDTEVKTSKFKTICVFCGSSQGKKPSYQEAAIELGNVLVSRNIDLVYGGGSIGLMGLVSQAVHDGGRHVIGVIPKTLMPREATCFLLLLESPCVVAKPYPDYFTNNLTGQTVGEVKAVADMHQRKAEMAKHSDAFIALPGGYGTLEELLEVITWAQLGIHDKPVVLICNSNLRTKTDQETKWGIVDIFAGWIAECRWILQLVALVHRQSCRGRLHLPKRSPYHCICSNSQGACQEIGGVRTTPRKSSFETELGDGAARLLPKL